MNQPNSKSSETGTPDLSGLINDTLTAVSQEVGKTAAAPEIEEVGQVTSIGRATVWITGLRKLKSEELVRFPGDKFGIAFNLDAEETGIVMLDLTGDLKAGDEAFRTGRVVSVPVGDALIGRVVDPLGRPLDGKGDIQAAEIRPVERDAPSIMDRLPVVVPLQTGIKLVDALIPIGRGQRELLVGDRQTGKTAVAVDTIINQKDTGVICVYCAIGQENSTLTKTIADLTANGAMEYSIVVTSSGRETPGLNFIAPYAATAIAEYFMDQGRDALIIYDDLTHHARAYRELSLLLRRPPAREAFPGDIFFIHSRLLERATHMAKGGSLTALPIIETEAQDISAYIPTNLISITDGQVYFSPKLFAAGVLPAIDVGQSVSRVGGKTQLPAYESVTGDLRLSYSQFEELEAFARFGTRMDEQTRKALDRGRRVREIMKQPQFRPVPVVSQIGLFQAVTTGYFDKIPLEHVPEAMGEIEKTFSERPDLAKRLSEGKELSKSDTDELNEIIAQVQQNRAKTAG